LAEGLYYGLEQSGAMLGVPDESLVREAVANSPRTRLRPGAFKVCGRRHFAQWDHITLQGATVLSEFRCLIYSRRKKSCSMFAQLMQRARPMTRGIANVPI
jgi:hypothetical protein